LAAEKASCELAAKATPIQVRSLLVFNAALATRILLLAVDRETSKSAWLAAEREHLTLKVA